MQKLFTSAISDTRIKRTEFERVRDMYRSSVNAAIIQLQKTFFEIYNNHTLLNILNNETLDFTYTNLKQYKKAQVKKDSLCLIHNVVNGNCIGSPHKELFLTNNCYLISVDYGVAETFKPINEIRAVRVVEHPFRNVTPFRPTQVDRDVEELSVVAIDIPLLLTQYWMFKKAQAQLPEEDSKSNKWFLMHYVISPMVRDTMEICFRNRLLNPHAIEGDFDNFITFFNSYENRLMNSAIDMVDEIKKAPRRFNEVIENIPALFSDTYKEAAPTELNDIGVYNYWLECYTFMRWIKPIMDIENLTIEHTTDNVHGRLKRVRRYIRMNKVDRLMPAVAEGHWLKDKKEMMERFK